MQSIDDFLQTHCGFAPIFSFKVSLLFQVYTEIIPAQKQWFLLRNLPPTSTLQVTGCKQSVNGSAY